MAIMGGRIKSRTERAGRHAIIVSQDLGDFATELRTLGFSDEAVRIDKAVWLLT